MTLFRAFSVFGASMWAFHISQNKDKRRVFSLSFTLDILVLSVYYRRFAAPSSVISLASFSSMLSVYFVSKLPEFWKVFVRVYVLEVTKVESNEQQVFQVSISILNHVISNFRCIY